MRRARGVGMDRNRLLVHVNSVSSLRRSAVLCAVVLSCAEGPSPVSDQTTSDELASGGADQATGGATIGVGGGGGSGGGEAAAGGAAPSSGGAGGDPGSGGAPASGGLSASGGAPPIVGPYFPLPGSDNQCPDPSLRLRFENKPLLGTQGELRVHDVADPNVVVARIDMADPTFTEQIGGLVFRLPAVYVVDKDVVFVLPRSSLKYGHSYYVLIEEGALLVVGEPDLTDPDAWRFSVAAAAPTDLTQLRLALDGTGQFCSLQGALDAAVTGTTINIEPGDYYGVSYVESKTGLTLIGKDRDTTRILGEINNGTNPSTRTRALLGSENLKQLTIE